jgi:enolase
MSRLALERSRHELECKERITEILDKYSNDDNEQLGVIEQRMTLADWVKYRALWDELGNVLILIGDDEDDA